MADDTALTITVSEAGKRLRISRWKAYEAAQRGEIPTIRIGRVIRVPIRALEKMLEQADAKTTA
jgi:excisionase family DNA binding protein